MRERERDNPEMTPGSGGPSEGDLDGIRDRADRIVAAGDDIIDRLLSSDSEAFLSANRQHGGQ